jgi:Tfp pilus assembly protein PilN
MTNPPNQLSFLPDDYLENKARRRTNIICACLLVIVMVAIGSAFWLCERSLANVEAEHRQVERQYTAAAELILQQSKMETKQRVMAHQAELTASLLEKVPRSHILAGITNALPAGVSLLSFNLTSKKINVAPPRPKSAFEKKAARKSGVTQAAAPEPTKYDVHMKLIGVADNDIQVSQYITRLNQSPLFRDVNLIITDEFTHDKSLVRRFQVEMTLNPEADVQKAAASTLKTAAVELKDLQEVAP